MFCARGLLGTAPLLPKMRRGLLDRVDRDRVRPPVWRRRRRPAQYPESRGRCQPARRTPAAAASRPLPGPKSFTAKGSITGSTAEPVRKGTTRPIRPQINAATRRYRNPTACLAGGFHPRSSVFICRSLSLQRVRGRSRKQPQMDTDTHRYEEAQYQNNIRPQINADTRRYLNPTACLAGGFHPRSSAFICGSFYPCSSVFIRGRCEIKGAPGRSS